SSCTDLPQELRHACAAVDCELDCRCMEIKVGTCLVGRNDLCCCFVLFDSFKIYLMATAKECVLIFLGEGAYVIATRQQYSDVRRRLRQLSEALKELLKFAPFIAPRMIWKYECLGFINQQNNASCLTSYAL